MVVDDSIKERRPYSQPKLQRFGTLASITQGLAGSTCFVSGDVDGEMDSPPDC